MASTGRELRSRWTSGQGLDRAKSVLAALTAGEALSSTGLPTVDGRVDLRGFPFPEPLQLQEITAKGTTVALGVFAGMVEVRSSVWSGLDLSGASLRRVALNEMAIDDCLFEGADCRNARVAGATLSDCSFERADLRDSSLGATTHGHRTTYSNVSFANARLDNSHAVEAHFLQCRFSDTRLNGVNFMGSQFVGGSFEGEVEDVILYGEPPALALEHGHDGSPNRMQGVDLRRARLRFVNFRHLELAEAQLPEDTDHLVVRPYAVLLRATVDLLRRDARPAAKRLALMLGEGELRWALADQDTGLLQLSGYRPDERAVLLEVLARVRSGDT